MSLVTSSPTKLVWTEHPLIDLVEGGRYRKLSEAEFAGMASALGEDAAIAYYTEREERIARALADPLNWGFELPHWAEIRRLIKAKQLTGIPGGNNSAKSFFMGKLAGEFLSGKFDWPNRYPGPAKVLGVTQDEGASLQYQQPAVFMHLPVAVRKFNTQTQKKRSAVTKISYTQANGFTEGTFVLPTRGQMWFKTVAQYLRDPNSFEGPSYHLILIDEGCPMTLLELLLVRAAKVGGKVVYGHTCVHGMDATMNSLLQGARVVVSLPMNWDTLHQEAAETGQTGPTAAATSVLPGAPNPAIQIPELSLNEVQVKGCPPGHFPFVMQPLDQNRGVIFPWCHWNPFQPRGTWREGRLPAIFDTCVGQPRWKVRVKLFGWIEKIAGARIGNFDPNIHVIPHAKVEQLLKDGALTTYCMADPHIARSYFIAWKGVDANGIEYLIDECPDMEEGEWVDANGEPGEGTRVYGSVGANFYKQLIRQRERGHGVEAVRRFGDPRAFATQAAAAEGGTSLFELYDRDERPAERHGTPPDWQNPEDDLAPMHWDPARIRATVDLDLERVVTKLAFDRARAEKEGGVTVENQPGLYVSDRCQNIIRALINFDGDAESPFKDPIDAGARYGFCEETPFIDQTVSNVKGGGGW